MSSTQSVLGEDAIYEILLRLPAIDLVCYKAVCKDWRSLISSAEFVSAHLKRSKSDRSSHYLLVHEDLDRSRTGPFQSDICCFSQGMVVIGSANGLICMAGNYFTSHSSHNGVFLLNPVTGLSYELPPPSTPSDQNPVIKYVFWCDDSVVVGGGGVYKVAKIFREFFGPIIVEVWVSSFPDTWTIVSTTALDLCACRCVTGPDALIEGLAACWTVLDRDDDIFVLLLDLKTLALQAIPITEPEMYEPTDEYGSSMAYFLMYGVNLKGNFVLLKKSLYDDGNCEIWTMLTDGSRSWKKSSTFCLDFLFDRPLGSVHGKLVLRTYNNAVTLFDMETRVNEVLGEGSNTSLTTSAHDFVGSLVSIEGFETSDLCSRVSWPCSFASGRVVKMKMQMHMPQPLPLPPH